MYGLKPVPFTEAHTLQGLSSFFQGPEFFRSRLTVAMDEVAGFQKLL
jgi:hypothetical protein